MVIFSLVVTVTIQVYQSTSLSNIMKFMGCKAVFAAILLTKLKLCYSNKEKIVPAQNAHYQPDVSIGSHDYRDVILPRHVSPARAEMIPSFIRQKNDRLLSTCTDSWNQFQIMIGATVAWNEEFGAVGAFSGNGNFFAASNWWRKSPDNVVRVYRRGSTSTSLSQVGPDLDIQGYSLSFSKDGRRLAIGNWEGHQVKVYKLNDAEDGWEQLGTTLSNGSNAGFGGVVKLSADGNTLVISDPERNTRNGLVVAYEWNEVDETWSKLGQDLYGANDVKLGWDLALSQDGNILVAGSKRRNAAGVVQIYKLNSERTSWIQESTLNGNQFEDYFGAGVELSYDASILAVSAHEMDISHSGQNEGQVTVFQRNTTTNEYHQIGDKINGEGRDNWLGWLNQDMIGNALRMDSEGTVLFIGSNRYGRIYERDLLTNMWSKVQTHNPHDRIAAFDMSADASVIAMGDIYSSGYRGRIVLYRNTCQELSPTASPSSEPTTVASSIPSPVPSFIPTITPQPTIDTFSWDLELNTPGYLKSPPIQDGVQEFITKFNMSDRDYGIEVFKPDCLTSSSGLPLIETIDSKAGGRNHLEAVFLYNQSSVQLGNLWSANSTGGDVDFCVKLSMYSNSSNGILFNFIETIYKIQVDLTTGFSTAIDVIRTEAGDGGVETIDIDENITAYQCNDTFHELASPPVLTQGNFLQICVETEPDSVFEVAKIKDVTVDQNGTKVFEYVTEFVDSYWAESSCQAVNTTVSVCKVKMQLLGEYFNDADPADLNVVGKVKMDYLGRRRLRDTMKRNLEQSGNAIFTLTAPLSSGLSDEVKDISSPEVSSIDAGSSAYNILYGSLATFSLIAYYVTGLMLIGAVTI